MASSHLQCSEDLTNSGPKNLCTALLGRASRFVVPHTNTFLMQPTVTNSLVSPDGFQLT